MKPYTVVQEIASAFQAWLNCIESHNADWQARHKEKIETLCKDYLPSGSGVDCGTKFDFSASQPDKLVFLVEYHHMDENGFYDGWTSHNVTVRPDWRGVRMTIGGRNRNDIKDYLGEILDYSLNQDIDI